MSTTQAREHRNRKKIKRKIKRWIERTEVTRLYIGVLMLTALMFGSDKFLTMAKSGTVGAAVYLAYCTVMVTLLLLGSFGDDER